MQTLGRLFVVALCPVALSLAACGGGDDSSESSNDSLADAGDGSGAGQDTGGSTPDATESDAGDASNVTPDAGSDTAEPDVAESDTTEADAGPAFEPPPCTADTRYALYVNTEGDVSDLTDGLPRVADSFTSSTQVAAGALFLCGDFAANFVVSGALDVVGAADADGNPLAVVDVSADSIGTPAFILSRDAQVEMVDVALRGGGNTLVRASENGRVVLQRVELTDSETATLREPAVLFEDGLANARFEDVRVNARGGLVEAFGSSASPGSIELERTEVSGIGATAITGSAFTVSINGSSFTDIGAVLLASQTALTISETSFTRVGSAFDQSGPDNVFEATNIVVTDSDLGRVAASSITLDGVVASGSRLLRVANVDTFVATRLEVTNTPGQVLAVNGVTTSAELTDSTFTGGTVTPGEHVVSLAVASGSAASLNVARVTVTGVDGAAMLASAGSSPTTVTDCTFDGNRSGLLATNGASITGSVFSNHSAGSALVVASGSPAPTSIENCRFEGNNSGLLNGGGLRLSTSGPVTVTDCVFSQNRNEAFGGAVLQEGTGALSIIGSSFLSNRAFCGGAISAPAATITSSTFGDGAEENTPGDFTACNTGTVADLDGLVASATCGSTGCTNN
jgi:hypothetical protein